MDFELQSILIEIAVSRGLDAMAVLAQIAVVVVAGAWLAWIWLRK